MFPKINASSLKCFADNLGQSYVQINATRWRSCPGSGSCCRAGQALLTPQAGQDHPPLRCLTSPTRLHTGALGQVSHWHHQDQYTCPGSGLSGEAWHNRSTGFLREGGWDLQTLVKTSASLFSRKAFELRVSPFPPLTLCAQHSAPGF